MAFNMKGSKFYGRGNQSKKSVLKAKETEAEFLARLKAEGQTVTKTVDIGDKAMTPGANMEDSVTGESTTVGNSVEHKYLRNLKKGEMTSEQRGRLKELDMKYLRNRGFVDGNKSEGFDTPTKIPTTMKKAPARKEDPSAGQSAKNKAEIDASAKAINKRRRAYAEKLAIARRKKAGEK